LTLPLWADCVEKLRISDGLIFRKEPVIPKSQMRFAMYKAIAYYLRHRSGLILFLEDGRLEIDNNMVENTIRPLALLRKNALFAGSEVGGQTWAFFASLVGTCNLNNVDPSAYFDWLFEKIEQGHPFARYDELLPWHCPTGCFGIE
jgi:transposase